MIDDIGLKAGWRAMAAAASVASSADAVDIVNRARRRRHRHLAAAMAVAVALTVGAAALRLHPDRTDKLRPAVPAGVTAKRIERPDLGFSVAVPSDWRDTSSLSRYPFFYQGPTAPPIGFVLANLVQPGDDSIDHVADEYTNSSNVVAVRSREHVKLDGVDAVRIRFTVRTVVQGGSTQTVDDTTFITRNRSGKLLAVTAGARAPRADDTLIEWVASTIELR